MKYIIEKKEGKFWQYFYSFDDFETAKEFCSLMKERYSKLGIKFRIVIIIIKGVSYV